MKASVDKVFWMSASEVTVEVADDGVGFDVNKALEPGHGLHNVRRRLQLCYEDAAWFDVESSAEGTRVRFGVPSVTPRQDSPAAVTDASTR